MTDTSLFRSSTARLVALLWLVFAGYVLVEAWNQVDGYRAAARGDTPRYSDYTHTYGASLLTHETAIEYLYLPRVMNQASRYAAQVMHGGSLDEAQERRVGFSPFMYPPTFIALIAPLALFPYLLSWLLWLGVTALPYLAAMRSILPGPLAWPVALAAPPVFYNLKYGQTGFLSAGLIGLGLHLLWRRPLLAGVLIGLASVKPNLGVLIPLALLAGGHWRAFAAATLTVLAAIGASLLAYGAEPWFAFIGTLQFHLEGFAHGAYYYAPMTTVLATLRMAGVPLDAAWLGQYASSTLMALLVAWVWWRARRRADLAGLQAAVLLLATPLALPSAYLYDLMILVPAGVWLWQDMRSNDAARWEYSALLGAFAGLLVVQPLAQSSGIQTGALLVGVLLALALRRYRIALGSASGGQ